MLLKTLYQVVFPLVFFFIASIGGVSTAGNKLPVESPLAMVNGVILSSDDLSAEMRAMESELDYRNQTLTSEQLDILKPQLTELLIERELLYQKAQKRNIRTAMSKFPER